MFIFIVSFFLTIFYFPWKSHYTCYHELYCWILETAKTVFVISVSFYPIFLIFFIRLFALVQPFYLITCYSSLFHSTYTLPHYNLPNPTSSSLISTQLHLTSQLHTTLLHPTAHHFTPTSKLHPLPFNIHTLSQLQFTSMLPSYNYIIMLPSYTCYQAIRLKCKFNGW